MTFHRIEARALVVMLAVVVLVVVADQYSKSVILAHLQPNSVRTIIPGFFNLVLTFNRGAAFGFLAGVSEGYREVLLALTTLIALAAIAYFLFTDYYRDRVGQLALSLIIGGAIGNIIDRMRLGSVVDFLDFYYQSYHWPAFNIADSCICLGVATLILFRPKNLTNSLQ